LAYMTVQGKRIYLGPWDSREAYEGYAANVAQMLANGGRLLPEADESLTVMEVIAAYLEYCEGYYGKDSDNLFSIVRALRTVKKLYGSMPARNLIGPHLLAIQASYVADGLTRYGCNRLVNLVRRMVRWAVSRHLIPASIKVEFESVEPLRRGHTAAPDREPVRPVEWEHVAETLPYLTVPVAGLVWLAWFSGARIGEIVGLRACDIDMSGPIWEYRPPKHKNTWRGQERVIMMGQACQMLVKAFVERRGTQDALFSPRDAIQERASRALTHRRENQKPGPRKTERYVQDQYDAKVITHSIRRAVAELNRDRVAQGLEPIPRWTVHQCRHAHATRVRRELGIEAARIALGHRDAGITLTYAEADLEVARQVAGLLG